MGLLEQLFNRFISPVLERVKAAFGPFGKLFDLIGKLWTQITSTKARIETLAQSIKDEIFEWRNFREAVPVRTGVINLPRAIDKSQQLLDQIRGAWQAIADLFSKLKENFNVETPAAEAEAAAKDIESSGVKAILEKFPRLAKGLEKVLGFLAIAVTALEDIEGAIDDVQTVVDAIKGIREEIETGSTIFLSQKNKRRAVRTEDGTVFKIRVGNLHS